MGKHAYLIMVHEQSYVLECLLRLLDNELNDIFIHIDKKSTFVDENGLRKFVSRSNLVFLKKYKVFWGDDSLVKATVALLKCALEYGGGEIKQTHFIGRGLALEGEYKNTRIFS